MSFSYRGASLADLQAAHKGHDEARTRLIRNLRPQLLRYITRKYGDPEAAEDITQEVTFAVLRSLHTLRIVSIKGFAAWLNVVIPNAVARHHAAEAKAMPGDEELWETAGLWGPTDSPEGVILHRHQLTATGREALGGLSGKSRDLFIAMVESGYTPDEYGKELSQLTGIPHGNVGTYAKRLPASVVESLRCLWVARRSDCPRLRAVLARQGWDPTAAMTPAIRTAITNHISRRVGPACTVCAGVANSVRKGEMLGAVALLLALRSARAEAAVLGTGQPSGFAISGADDGLGHAGGQAPSVAAPGDAVAVGDHTAGSVEAATPAPSNPAHSQVSSGHDPQADGRAGAASKPPAYGASGQPELTGPTSRVTSVAEDPSRRGYGQWSRTALLVGIAVVVLALVAAVLRLSGTSRPEPSATLSSGALSGFPATLATAGGAAPSLVAWPASVSFDETTLGGPRRTRTIIVTNLSADQLTIEGTAVTGDDAGDFTASDHCPRPRLAPGGSCTVDLTFAPGAIGARHATMALTYLGGALAVAMIGTAVAPPAPVGTSPPSSTGVSGPPPPPPAREEGNLTATPGLVDLGTGDRATLGLANTGGAALDWSSASDRPWLSMSPRSGRLRPGQRINVVVSIDRPALPEGDLSGVITVAPAGGSTGGAAVTVRAVVDRPPVIHAATVTPINCAFDVVASVSDESPPVRVLIEPLGNPMALTGADYRGFVANQLTPVTLTVAATDARGNVARRTLGPVGQAPCNPKE
ncbi:MAG: choice-of-anchor D domain-containing protein [Acidimicrobiales bacterium]